MMRIVAIATAIAFLSAAMPASAEETITQIDVSSFSDCKQRVFRMIRDAENTRYHYGGGGSQGRQYHYVLTDTQGRRQKQKYYAVLIIGNPDTIAICHYPFGPKLTLITGS